MGRRNYLIVVGFIASGAVACTEGTSPPVSNNTDGGTNADAMAEPQPVDQAISAQRSAQFAGDVIRQLGGAISFPTAEGSVLSRLGGQVMGMRRSPSAQAVNAPLPRPMLDRLMETPIFKSLRPRPGFISLTTQEENFDDTASDIEDFFKTRLFVAANVESSTATSVTYQLKADPTCRPLPSEISAGRMDRVDLKCGADLAKLQVRIVVTSDGDGYRYQILLGPDKLELSVFIIHSDLLGWEADLNKARLATQYANMVLGDEADREEEPFPFSVLEGRIKIAVQKLGDKKASISWSVLEPIRLQDMDHHSFAMAVANPVFALSGDGVAKTVTLKLAIPQTDVRAPWDPRDMGTKNLDLHVSFGGLHGESTLSEMAEELAFTGLGVGPSFVEVRTTKIFELAFNTANASKMDLKIKPIADDQARFELSPRFDLSLAFKLMPVLGEFSEAPDSFLHNETYSLVMMGSAPVVVETVAANDAGFEGGFKMVAGSLTLSTTSDPAATVTVPPGQCLTELPTPADGSHPLLGQLHSAACP